MQNGRGPTPGKATLHVSTVVPTLHRPAATVAASVADRHGAVYPTVVTVQRVCFTSPDLDFQAGLRASITSAGRLST